MATPTPLRAPQRIDPNLKRFSRSTNRFEVDPAVIPEGWSYEWKRFSVYGQEDRQHQVFVQRNHWKPVPAGRHPEISGESPDSTKPIIIDGLMLMERPAYLTQQAREEDLQNAIGQHNAQMQRLDQIDGIGPDAKPQQANVNRNWERSAVPDDEPGKDA